MENIGMKSLDLYFSWSVQYCTLKFIELTEFLVIEEIFFNFMRILFPIENM